MKNTLFATLLFLVSNQALSAPEIKGSPDDLKGFLYPSDKVVTIVGEAQATAYSDKAIVSLVVTTQKETLSAALEQNGNLRRSVTSKLTKGGISPDAINSSKFSSSPEYGWFSKKPSSYKVVNRLAIAITEEEHLQEIAKVADSSDKIELADTTFEHTKKNEFNDKVKAQALQKILAQKKFYEQTLGVTLTPIGIRDASVKQRGTRGARALEEIIVTARKRTDGDSYYSGSAYSQQETPSFDEVFYDADVSVDFAIKHNE